MKEIMKTKFRAVINIESKVFTFSKSSDTEMGLIKLVREAGLNISNIKTIQSFQVSTEKLRGKTARKY